MLCTARHAPDAPSTAFAWRHVGACGGSERRGPAVCRHRSKEARSCAFRLHLRLARRRPAPRRTRVRASSRERYKSARAEGRLGARSAAPLLLRGTRQVDAVHTQSPPQRRQSSPTPPSSRQSRRRDTCRCVAPHTEWRESRGERTPHVALPALHPTEFAKLSMPLSSRVSRVRGKLSSPPLVAPSPSKLCLCQHRQAFPSSSANCSKPVMCAMTADAAAWQAEASR
eukprot:1270440-Rhodomonas_salina.1